ncbi:MULTISPECIES: LysR family transcriptional regulator [Pseudomonadaceae]|jgi:DNA-binding transcriptional LysR family regulator|uniref:LysR family transcriptional regulator n=3 Tax=Pseudomonas TaxID=286 RepID=A0A7Y8AT28_PSETO|nr:LysR family transcriptional regulator [Pseudomonas putida]MBF4560441.1 LysR family transcriptional regulator [Pseudomonas sp. p50(2008)]MBF6043573.1 LysR family transcriptional regulator [Pseudomonas mucoides]MBK3915757.1 LysR family transcriptional regulator [Stutzerimonas frequens]MBX9410420.1 LysR family transcriptional regulator [Pseudomonas baetica]NVZ48629.1 LysR family transcriptional regulator [Pseudomonas tolaasii]NWE89985.1 LysR family transcriptional regulator [Pseudomonas react
MLNRLEALKIFCVVAEVLQFRDAANRLNLSPQVVTRTIGALEREFGEVLFYRTTRQVRLSGFGEQLLPQARQLIKDSERLFQNRCQVRQDLVSGLVRVSVPDSPCMRLILGDILDGLRSYPSVILKWNVKLGALDDFDGQGVDILITLDLPSDNRWIVRKAGVTRNRIVAAPSLIDRIGMPKNIEDLQQNFPLSTVTDPATGRACPWYIHQGRQFFPAQPYLTTDDLYSQLEATRAGHVISYIQGMTCLPYLANRELIEVLPELERASWPIYVCHPQRTDNCPRVDVVFEMLVESLNRRL